VVIYPAVELVRASLGRYSITGLHQGAVGLRSSSDRELIVEHGFSGEREL